MSALAFGTIKRDSSIERADVLPDNIHPNASSGQVTDLFLRGKARFKYQETNLFITEIRVGGNQISRSRLLPNACKIEPATIINNLNQDGSRLVRSPETDRTFWILASPYTHIRCLNAMICGIPQNMSQRIAQHFEYSAVHFSLVTLGDQAQLFPRLFCQVMDQPVKSTEKRS